MDPGLDDDQGVTVTSTGGKGAPATRRLSAFLYRHDRLRLAGLLTPPILWLVVLYIGSLGVMLVSSLWGVDSFTGSLVKKVSWSNYHTLFTQPVYRTVALRTLGIAVSVTLIDLVLALPLAFFISKVVQGRRWRYALLIMVTMPLWASYLVKGYAWRIMFDKGGVIDRMFAPLGLHGPGLGLTATVVALAYLWLPYMVLPIYAGLERLPESLLEASADLGAAPLRTLRSVVFPLLVPSVVAGSIFTFSLTLGDYIMVKIVGGTTQMFANIVYDNVGVAGNLPFAAAAAVFPIVVILGYLLAVRRSGALENL
ncbi:MAG: putative spermidine/putrescine transport system permease protein [Actinomycetota bacterium]|nr:putative spermidine/putrescine transport system permease protein [Actinomycetota bacterium]